jgi:hypothetical protein
MNGESYFHVGLIVPKLEPALEELTALLGLAWRDTVDGDVPVRNADGSEQVVRIRFAYSQQAPYLEVIEGVPGTPWAYSDEGSNLHHLGFFSDDVPADAQRVSRTFCPSEVCGMGPGGACPAGFSYHAKGGLRIELIDSAVRAIMFGD